MYIHSLLNNFEYMPLHIPKQYAYFKENFLLKDILKVPSTELKLGMELTCRKG